MVKTLEDEVTCRQRMLDGTVDLMREKESLLKEEPFLGIPRNS